jgi:hypothetical protein
MKTTGILLAIGFALHSAALAHAYVSGRDGPVLRTAVNFFEAEKFADVADSSSRSDADRDRILAALKEYLIQRASRIIPATHKLVITVTDVDLAGDFEPWGGPSFDDIRIVKDLYPPRIELVFRLTDPEGNIVKEGRRVLRDLTFLMKLPADRNDLLRHEKALLDDWLRGEFGRAQ